eukprot:TRINITY_DN3432_c0_g1_i1.p1 TRINITY_DN3432_c0_g1~~TRINITY_DN3432_c0_g1_i1.p1  ORF type:complete len:252 (-),score=59.35 TRINITY_DN3432_c0_g1_i1:199-873(-)
MELFNDLEREFTRVSADVSDGLSDITTDRYLTGERRKDAIHEVDKQLEQLSKILQQMNSLLKRNAHQSLTLQPKVRKCEADLQTMRRELDRIKNTGGGGGGQVGGWGGGDDEDDLEIRWQDQRQQLLSQTAKQDKTLERIDRSQATAEDALAVGHATLDTLEAQGKQLNRAKDNLGVIDDNMSRSRKIMRQMYAKVISNKILLLFIIFCEIVVLVFIVYWKWFR